MTKAHCRGHFAEPLAVLLGMSGFDLQQRLVTAGIPIPTIFEEGAAFEQGHVLIGTVIRADPIGQRSRPRALAPSQDDGPEL